MDSTHLSGLQSRSLTGLLFGMLYDCPRACSTSCPLTAVRHVDLTTTFYHLKSLSREDKLWLVYRYEHCPVRMDQLPPERRHYPREEIGHGFGKQAAVNV